MFSNWDMELFLVFFSYPFYVYGICSDILAFISDTSNLCPLSVFLSLARDLLILLIFSKKHVLSSLIFSIDFLTISLNSALSSIVSSLLLALDLICSSFFTFLR